jgi:hypothetical protein
MNTCEAMNMAVSAGRLLPPTLHYNTHTAYPSSNQSFAQAQDRHTLCKRPAAAAEHDRQTEQAKRSRVIRAVSAEKAGARAQEASSRSAAESSARSLPCSSCSAGEQVSIELCAVSPSWVFAGSQSLCCLAADAFYMFTWGFSRVLVQDAALDAAPAQLYHKQQQLQQQQQVLDSSTDASMRDATAEAGTSDLEQPTSADAAADGLSLQLYGLDGIDSSRLSGAALRSYFAQQLMVPEWLTDIPPDLATNW